MKREYLFRGFSESHLTELALRLKVFRFFRAYGGLANDGDSLDFAVRYDSKRDLIALMKSMGIELNELSADAPRMVPGIRYTAEGARKTVTEIRDFPGLEQPGRVKLYGQDVFIWCVKGKAKVSLTCFADNGFSVAEDDFTRAEMIEARLPEISDRIIDPPEDTDHYFCPLYYPNNFKVQQDGGGNVVSRRATP